MKKIMGFAVAILLTTFATAQNKTANSLEYKTAAGIKVWDGVGLSLKTFIQDKAALEFVGFFNSAGARVTGLYEFHGDLNTEGNLKWYIGPGAHVGFYKGNNTLVGIDGVVGLDYKFNELPLNISLDWQPSFEFSKGYGFAGGWGGLGIRYTF
ncbi:MAG: hypothetical protein IPL97_05010 [Niastella sp.]|nr:hypothetical protein [Niastella sp.]